MGECQSNLECRRDEKNTGVPEQPSETARNRRSVGKPEGVGTGSVRAGNRRNRKAREPKTGKPENGKARCQTRYTTEPEVAVRLSAGLSPEGSGVTEPGGREAGKRNAPERDRGTVYNRRESEATLINPLKYKAYL